MTTHAGITTDEFNTIVKEWVLNARHPRFNRDVGDLNLLNSIYVFPSFTESGRWRSDIKLDIKYDFPKDFYLRFGVTLNYDNRPAVAGKETDYVFNISVGWEL